MFENVFNGMFSKIGPGMCRLTVNGKIAVKTSGGYKAYDVEKGTLTNCSNFAFDVGDDMFFSIPTNKVQTGDIIIVGGKPKCVISVTKKTITVLNYEDSTIDTLVPERYVFMGQTYFYSKIYSPFGNKFFGSGKDGIGEYMKFAIMSAMMNGKETSGGMSSILPLMLMSGGGANMFDGMFDLNFFDAIVPEDSEEDAAIPEGEKTDKKIVEEE